MGLEIDRDEFAERDFERFDERLGGCLEALRGLLERPGFGDGPPSLGAELELSLVDAAARAAMLNGPVLERAGDPRLTFELDRFNLECNLEPTLLAGRPFAALESEMNGALSVVRRAAAALDTRVALVGILPTLRVSDLGPHAMTDSVRYRALSRALRRNRRGPFRVRIHGEDPLDIEADDVTFEGANTSLQIHLRVSPDDFAPVFNAVQLATVPALAASGNSPSFLGHLLWEETRVALFKQAVDGRDSRQRAGRGLARVAFGHGWTRDGVYELFEQSVRDYAAMLPVLSDQDPMVCARNGELPKLEEVRLHQGTIWHWNRPVYDPAGGGHFRIEMRALPSGPSVGDMLANIAFLVGAALGLAPRAAEWVDQLPFAEVEGGFYRAAREGLDARLLWPDASGVRERSAREVALELVPVAERALVAAGVEPSEARRWLAVFEARAESRRTGSAWQRAALARLEARSSRDEALCGMLEGYLARQAEGRPVHEWEPGTT